jgi:hypothetical protein
MAWIPAALAVVLVLAVSFPFLMPRLTRGRRARKAHRGDVVHLYANYDDDLRFEPRHERDIVAVARRELEAFGYRPGSESAVVPRTFRGRVAGDERLRLWTPRDESLRPVWVCTWHGVELPRVEAPAGTATLTREFLATAGSPPPVAGPTITRGPSS